MSGGTHKHFYEILPQPQHQTFPMVEFYIQNVDMQISNLPKEQEDTKEVLKLISNVHTDLIQAPSAKKKRYAPKSGILGVDGPQCNVKGPIHLLGRLFGVERIFFV